MNNTDLTELLGATDIYLIDQILKGRYQDGDVLLDAGCGRGRNLQWFLQAGFDVYAVDAEPSVIANLQQVYSHRPQDRFRVSAIENLPFDTAFFDGIFCSAVLHFSRNQNHFFAMLDNLFRVLKVGGSLFIRMASDIGIEDRVEHLSDGVYFIPDGSTRFLLTRSLLAAMQDRFRFTFLEDFKTTNVADLRCMSTLVVQK